MMSSILNAKRRYEEIEGLGEELPLFWMWPASEVINSLPS